MSFRRRIFHDTITAAVFFLVTFALLLTAQASAGAGSRASGAAEGTSSATLMLITSIVGYGAWCLLAVAMWLGQQRQWRWTRWFRVGRRQANIAGALGAITGLLGQAEAGELRPYVLLIAIVQWLQMSSMPGKGERASDAEAGAPT